MGTVTQTRAVSSAQLLVYQYKKGTNPQRTGTVPAFAGSQTTTSYRTEQLDRDGESALTLGSGNRIDFQRNLHRAYQTRYDNGHEFYTKLTYPPAYTHPSGFVFERRGAPGVQAISYNGFAYPAATGQLGANDASISSADISADGRAAIKATIPTTPDADLATFLGELREKLPSLVGSLTKKQGLSANSVGGEHLNIEFGIKPVIADLQKLGHGLLHASSILKQYQRDSGKNVRRKRQLYNKSWVVDRGTLPSSLVVQLGPEGAMSDKFVTSSFSTCRVIDEYRQRAWFSGAYTYHLAEGHSIFDKMDRYEALAQQLIGLRPTPGVVWNLTPWSWLLDWWGDIGTFMSNVSSFTNDNLVLRYGYIMHETHATRIRTLPLIRYQNNGSSGTATTSSRYATVTKQRKRSTPYGFDVDLHGLSPRRWAILAALGMTKSDKELRVSVS